MYMYRLNTPMFSKYDFSSQIPERIEVLSVDQIKRLTMDYIEVISIPSFTTILKYYKYFSSEYT